MFCLLTQEAVKAELIRTNGAVPIATNLMENLACFHMVMCGWNFVVVSFSTLRLLFAHCQNEMIAAVLERNATNAVPANGAPMDAAADPMDGLEENAGEDGEEEAAEHDPEDLN